jgi:secondary thiamine-phosphate synthase enzyme
MEKFTVRSTDHTSIIDITQQIQSIVTASGIKNGICYVFIPHTTAGISINENADPDVKSDILKEINKVIPFKDSYRHMEGNSAAHIKSSLFGNTETIFLENGRLQLGTWQGIFFCEFDGPRTRQVWIKLILSE